MNNYFEVKAKVKRIDNVTGKEKQVSEQYLVNALSFTEAESRNKLLSGRRNRRIFSNGDQKEQHRIITARRRREILPCKD